jgi:hypothetical protein
MLVPCTRLAGSREPAAGTELWMLVPVPGSWCTCALDDDPPYQAGRLAPELWMLVLYQAGRHLSFDVGPLYQAGRHLSLMLLNLPCTRLAGVCSTSRQAPEPLVSHTRLQAAGAPGWQAPDGC